MRYLSFILFMPLKVGIRLRIIINHEKEENLMKFGENLRNLRKVKKLSQENLAEKMKVSRQSVSKWETGMLLYK